MKTTGMNRNGRKIKSTDNNYGIRKTDSNLTMVGDRTFYIYSVVAEQSPTDSSWARIVFNGWEQRDDIYARYLCCLQFANGSVTSTTSTSRRKLRNNYDLIAKQVVCKITDISPPDLAGLVLSSESCKTDAVFHHVLFRKHQEKSTFAICAKIAYRNKNPIELIEWMEYHLHFGASAVVIYPYYDLKPGAMKVLNYYANREQIEMVPLPRVPLSDTFKRNFAIGSPGRDNDEQVPNFDAQERLLGYKYYTIMDTDEFIVPGNNTNITNFVQLMEYLTEKYENAGTFRMLTEAHLLNWNKTNISTDIRIAQHGYHTEPRNITTKFLHVTDRVVPGTVWIHGVNTKKGFTRYSPDPNDVVLKHYRYCKAIWFRREKDYTLPCVKQFDKIMGHFMDNIAKMIAPRILKVKRHLNLN